MAETLLKIDNLSTNIGDKSILHGISLDIAPGETHVLMGPNGAGKSTLGYTLMGSPEYSIAGGKIFFNGEDVTELSADGRAKKGIFLSFQEPLEVPGISLESFIRSSMTQVSGTKVKLFAFQKELERCMDILNMNHSYAERDLNVGFSGGEKKKSEILQLLMLKPRLAILDETDSGLDVDAVRTVSKGIEEYQKSTGGSLLIITHSTRILESLKVDRTHIMVKGRIVHSGDGSLVQKINEEGFDQFIPQEIKDAERREKLAAAAKNAMDAVKANAARELEGLSMDEVKKSINGGSN
ncbi:MULTISPECIES: Fe-S cluster assembly ATPase SufC [Treponema]|uniref:Fe-S cluster assembly ATP-binding protein n=1 Tax=Treponema rectale TaxID=744512 RepID=A0A840SBE8_9SPIR|nr:MULTISPECIES: Fe-S cluster assembly ATPase SufC [Treponema]MBB5218154.1 Fe-S cluster assembly ATP-binding protein [Treponema rectale]MBE6354466.1 Fe-S cluster assembly ATPase SufC [Treponema sp.]QOS40140.1 Fe-S cluster assembly ATPase SufC [Treponema rectale]